MLMLPLCLFYGCWLYNYAEERGGARTGGTERAENLCASTDPNFGRPLAIAPAAGPGLLRSLRGGNLEVRNDAWDDRPPVPGTVGQFLLQHQCSGCQHGQSAEADGGDAPHRRVSGNICFKHGHHWETKPSPAVSRGRKKLEPFLLFWLILGVGTPKDLSPPMM